MPFEIFRGDSFQAVFSRPDRTLFASVLLFLKLSLYNTGAKDIAARLSIGIGTIDYLLESGSVGETDGTAFRLNTGRDSIKAGKIPVNCISEPEGCRF